MTQPRRGWGTGGCSLARPRGQCCLHGVRGTTACQRSHTHAQVPTSAFSSVGEPEGDSASAPTCHLPKRGAKVHRGWAVLSLSLPLAKGLHCPVWQQRRRKLPGAQGMQMHPKLQRTNFPGTPGPLRSEETEPGSSRDQRGVQCQGLTPPPPPPPPSPVVPVCSPHIQGSSAHWHRDLRCCINALGRQS